MKQEVTAFAPATVANVACGFDILGLALEAPGDRVTARRVKKVGVRIVKLEGNAAQLSNDAEKNTAGVAALELLKMVDPHGRLGIELELDKQMPIGSGMGSSAASAVAAVVAVNELLEKPLHRIDLLPHVMHAEKIACGTAHADNVAPSLLGGFVLIRSYDPLDVMPLPVPDELYVTLVHPELEIRTADARAVMKREVSLAQVTEQVGNAAALVVALFKNDYELLGRALKDVVAEPMRSLLIPGFAEAKQAALAAGALGFSISGSGPSVFTLSRGKKIAEAVQHAIQKSFALVDIATEGYVSPVNAEGAKILSSH